MQRVDIGGQAPLLPCLVSVAALPRPPHCRCRTLARPPRQCCDTLVPLSLCPDNVFYAEIRTTPKCRSETGVSRETYVEAVLQVRTGGLRWLREGVVGDLALGTGVRKQRTRFQQTDAAGRPTGQLPHWLG